MKKLTSKQTTRLVFGVITITNLACSGAPRQTSGAADDNSGGRGNRLVAALRADLKSFNRLANAETAEEIYSRLTQATLLRVNQSTGALEPRLATNWTASPDGLTWTFTLRDGVTFSDGQPFTSADVVFSAAAAYDAKVGSSTGESLMVNGKPLTVRALDARTVVVVFPAPYGPGIALLDALPIFPSHKLKAALDAGTLRDAWPITTPAAELVGLGPFVLKQYAAGQRIVFSRNPRSWLKDERGTTLPYVDEIEVQIVPDQNVDAARLQAGESDFSNEYLRADDVAAFRALADQGKVKILTAGPSASPDGLWFNLTAGAAAAKGRPWLQREELRKAISLAVDRQAVANKVYLGAATPIAGPITPSYGEWFGTEAPVSAPNLAEARAQLARIGLTDRNGDGLVDDAAGKTAKFSVITIKGSTVRERTMTVVQEQLRAIGLQVDVELLPVAAMREAWGKAAYDAIYFSVNYSSADPARNPEFWLSSGNFHFWNPDQKTPATAWEAQIDGLMSKVSTEMDPARRRQHFFEVQRVFNEHMPVIYFVAAHLMVATHSRVQGATLSVFPPPIFWNAERLSVGR